MDLDERYGEKFKRDIGEKVTNDMHRSKKGMHCWDLTYLAGQLVGVTAFCAAIITQPGERLLKGMPMWLALLMLAAWMAATVAVVRSHSWRVRRETALFSIWVLNQLGSRKENVPEDTPEESRPD